MIIMHEYNSSHSSSSKIPSLCFDIPLPSDKPNYDSFDLFLIDSFLHQLKKIVGAAKFQKIEKKLGDLFGIDIIANCMSDDFGRICFVAVIANVLGRVTSMRVMQNIVKKMFSAVVFNNKDDEDGKHVVIILHDQSMCKKIILSYGDIQKKKILDLLCNKSMMLGTLYRHTKKLIDEGLLVVPTDENQEVRNVYTCMFSGFESDYRNDGNDEDTNKAQVAVTVKKEFLKSSLLYCMHPSVGFSKNTRFVCDGILTKEKKRKEEETWKKKKKKRNNHSNSKKMRDRKRENEK